MSTWGDIEAAVVTTLGGLSEGDAPLLPTVTGHAAADRKTLTAAILRERPPAAFVIVEGRDTAVRGSGNAGSATVTILLANRDLRPGDGARTGSADSAGIFTLAQAVVTVLQAIEVIPAWRMSMLREQAWPMQEGTALWEVTFAARRVAELNVPTFGGAVLTGTYATVRVDLGEVRMASSGFCFPGIDGVFERRLGVRERPIWWRGELRGLDAELNNTEAAIENEVRAAQPKSMLDAYGRELDNCVLKAFRRAGARQRDAVTGEAVQGFEMEFVQLRG